MMSTLAPPSVLSAPQRRCQMLLTLFLPGQSATAQTFSSLNGVDDNIVREDIIGAGLEIQRYHRLAITSTQNGRYQIEGTPLNQRLCLLHWLRRGLRLCPTFINQQFTPALKMELKQQGIARQLYDEFSPDNQTHSHAGNAVVVRTHRHRVRQYSNAVASHRRAGKTAHQHDDVAIRFRAPER